MPATSLSDPAVIRAWLGGLLAIARAGGELHAAEMQALTQLSHERFDQDDLDGLEPLEPPDLARALAAAPALHDDFLRTAVIVALADGIFSRDEAELLRAFAAALGHQPPALDLLETTRCDPDAAAHPEDPSMLTPLRHWLDGLQVHDPRLAHLLVQLIPAQCPFERDVVLFGRKLLHIPPMCKLNPVYDELVGLRFRALSYLADECGEDVSALCSAETAH